MSSKGLKKRTVDNGIFYAELNDFLREELEQDNNEAGFAIGYAGVEVRRSAQKVEIIIRATRTQPVVGNKGQRIHELTEQIKHRFGFKESPKVELFAERVNHRALCALAQAEAVKYKLLEGTAVRRACYRALRFIMESEAKGCEIVVSGKLRGQRAKAMKFKQGYMIASGDAKNHYIDRAVKHVKLRQGVLGIQVKIMLPHDPAGIKGPQKCLPDKIEIREPKTFDHYATPVGLAHGIPPAQAPADVDQYDQTTGGPADYQTPGGPVSGDARQVEQMQQQPPQPEFDQQQYGAPPPQQPPAQQMGYAQQTPGGPTPGGFGGNDGQFFGQ